MNCASQCSLAGRYDNPIPPRFLTSIDCLKIPGQYTHQWTVVYTQETSSSVTRVTLPCTPSPSFHELIHTQSQMGSFYEDQPQLGLYLLTRVLSVGGGGIKEQLSCNYKNVILNSGERKSLGRKGSYSNQAKCIRDVMSTYFHFERILITVPLRIVHFPHWQQKVRTEGAPFSLHSLVGS